MRNVGKANIHMRLLKNLNNNIKKKT